METELPSTFKNLLCVAQVWIFRQTKKKGGKTTDMKIAGTARERSALEGKTQATKLKSSLQHCSCCFFKGLYVGSIEHSGQKYNWIR